MKVEVKAIKGKEHVVVSIPIDPRPSRSGKNITIASSYGVRPTTAQYNGKPVTVGVNAFVPID